MARIWPWLPHPGHIRSTAALHPTPHTLHPAPQTKAGRDPSNSPGCSSARRASLWPESLQSRLTGKRKDWGHVPCGHRVHSVVYLTNESRTRFERRIASPCAGLWPTAYRIQNIIRHNYSEFSQYSRLNYPECIQCSRLNYPGSCRIAY